MINNINKKRLSIKKKIIKIKQETRISYGKDTKIACKRDFFFFCQLLIQQTLKGRRTLSRKTHLTNLNYSSATSSAVFVIIQQKLMTPDNLAKNFN